MTRLSAVLSRYPHSVTALPLLVPGQRWPRWAKLPAQSGERIHYGPKTMALMMAPTLFSVDPDKPYGKAIDSARQLYALLRQAIGSDDTFKRLRDKPNALVLVPTLEGADNPFPKLKVLLAANEQGRTFMSVPDACGLLRRVSDKDEKLQCQGVRIETPWTAGKTSI